MNVGGKSKHCSVEGCLRGPGSQTSTFRNFNSFMNRDPSLGNELGANKLTQKINYKGIDQHNIYH